MKNLKLFISILILGCNFGVSYSQTYQAPTIACVQRSTNANNITWHNPTETCGPFEKYYIHVSTAKNGPYQILDSVTDITANSYTHTPITNSSTYYYYLSSKYDCPGLISALSDTMEDTRIPTPKLLTISIEGQLPVYKWISLDTRREVWGYPIITPDKIIDTVRDRFASTTLDGSFDVNTGPYTGAVSAMDSCGGVNGRSSYFFQRTCFLTLNNNPCNGSLNMSWTRYMGWTNKDEVYEYRIMIQKGNGPEIAVDRTDSSVRAYIYSDFKYGDTLHVRIRAINPIDTSIYSNSNRYYIISKKSVAPTTLHLTSASYLNNYQVKVNWYCDPETRPKSFSLFLKDPKSHHLISKRISVPFISDGNGNYYTIDNNGSSTQQVKYEIELEDSCNNKYPGIPANSIFLKVDQIGIYKNDVTWSQLIFPDSVLYTIINRELHFSADGTHYSSLAFLDNITNSYRHEVDEYPNTTGNFCYKLLTRYKLDTTTSLKNIVRDVWSETVCIPMRTILYMPNAFRVNGLTPSFKPRMLFYTTGDFKMKIYNRWGEMIFETNDHEAGWNGIMKNGTIAPEDSYMYIVTYTGNDGVPVSKNGNFVLLK